LSQDYWQTFSKRRGEKISLQLTGPAFANVQTKFQNMVVAETVPHGRALFLDGKIQSGQNDEFVYHECLVHPALVAHPGPRRVFIAGGGEGRRHGRFSGTTRSNRS
jgi:spermidine synthase